MAGCSDRQIQPAGGCGSLVARGVRRFAPLLGLSSLTTLTMSGPHCSHSRANTPAAPPVTLSGHRLNVVPPSVAAARTRQAAQELCYNDRIAKTIVPTLYDPEEFAALYHADTERAIAFIAAMTAP
jgi:hypothetical protein